MSVDHLVFSYFEFDTRLVQLTGQEKMFNFVDLGAQLAEFFW